jgi:NAD(P)-dependent dehydrogenase (short-subunit alcohol dehydrogenase family)
MSKVWLVTGSASGLGREIAEAVLASGDRLLATARDPRRLNDLVERYGQQVSIAPLDVADETAAKTAVARAVDVFGRLDVLVNKSQLLWLAGVRQGDYTDKWTSLAGKSMQTLRSAGPASAIADVLAPLVKMIDEHDVAA